MSITAKSYLAMMLSLVLLAGAAIAPACAHGSSCSYTARRTVSMNAPVAQAAAEPQPVEHGCSHAVPAAHAVSAGPSAPSAPAATPAQDPLGTCCSSNGPESRMRYSEDAVTLANTLLSALPAVQPLEMAVQDVPDAAPLQPETPSPALTALTTTIIRI